MRSLREKCSQQRKNARKGSPGIAKDRAHTNRLLWSTSWINKTKRNWGEHNWKRSAHFRRVVVVGAGTCFEPSIEGWMSFCVRWSVTVWPWETSAVGARSRTTGTLCRGTGTLYRFVCKSQIRMGIRKCCEVVLGKCSPCRIWETLCGSSSEKIMWAQQECNIPFGLEWFESNETLFWIGNDCTFN